MAQYFLPVEFDKYIVLDQDLLPFSLQIITGLAFLYQFSYGPGHRGHNMKYAYVEQHFHSTANLYKLGQRSEE